MVYGSVLQDRRKALHARIMEVIELHYVDRLTEQIEQLAHHALRGEVWDQALAYSQRAMAKSIQRSANREAWSHLEHALAVPPHLPQDRTRLEQAVDLRLTARFPLFALGEFTRVLELAQEAVSLSQTLNDARREVLAQAALSGSMFPLGRYADALEHAHHALELAEALHDPLLRIAACYPVGLVHWSSGNSRAAINFFKRDVGLAHDEAVERLLATTGEPSLEHSFARTAYCISQIGSGHCLGRVGEFDQALACAERAVSFARALDVLYLRAMSETWLASVHLLKGDLQAALQLARRWIQNYGAADLANAQVNVAMDLASVFNLTGHWEDALALFERAWPFAESNGLVHYQTQLLSVLAETYGYAGRTEEGIATALRSLGLARQLGAQATKAVTLYRLGALRTNAGVPDLALAHDNYLEACQGAHELGHRPLEAQCYLALGELAKRAGHRQDAQHHLKTAVSMFSEMGMTFWLEKAEAAGAE